MNKKAYIIPDLEVIESKASYQLLSGSEIPKGVPGSADDAESPGMDIDTNMFGF